jgi:Concanavalin A-like lectin/glucanases superfamily
MLINAHRHSFTTRAISLTLFGALAASGCAGGDAGVGTGGKSGTGGATASGGATGTGGGTGTGGATGSGGATGTGGAVGTGGSGTGGAVGSGGNGVGGAGTGGCLALPPASCATGSGGSNTGGAGGGATGGRGGTTGAGGAGGRGGSGMGGSSTGGAGGATNCAGHAISFSANGTGAASDSAQARVVIDLMTDLPLANANRTVEFWAFMKTTDWNANTNTLFFYGPNPSARNADGFGLDFGSNTGTMGSIDPFTNAIFDHDNQPSGVTNTMNQWVHFAMTWDGTTVRAYVNGVLRSTMAAPGSSAQKVLMTGRSPLTIGGYPTESAYFNGYIDEFRVWGVERSVTQIMSTMNHALVGNETGLVGYWKFDEASGTTVADSVTTANHVAHVGTVMANTTANNPTFITPVPLPPITCP